MIRQRAAWRNEVVRRADTTMRQLIGASYSSGQLCKRIGMSERNLELYFREALGVTPKAWFHHLSLHRARVLLRRKEPHEASVTEVALACGFEHFGRFSEAYRETLRRTPPGNTSSPCHRGTFSVTRQSIRTSQHVLEHIK